MVRRPENRLEPYFAAMERERRMSAAVQPPNPYPKAAAAMPRSRWVVAWKVGLLVVLAWLAWETRGVGQAIRDLSAVQAQFRR